MDIGLAREHLAEAERHIALSEKHIARQIEIVGELEDRGHSTELAMDVLNTFCTIRTSHLAHRAQIIRELEG